MLFICLFFKSLKFKFKFDNRNNNVWLGFYKFHESLEKYEKFGAHTIIKNEF